MAYTQDARPRSPTLGQPAGGAISTYVAYAVFVLSFCTASAFVLGLVP